eukprot:TRINITY_DN35779_c0_g1_i1.p1 TRINITY_DN35779_c0_g1~~TRINITY_DN35779_c0_g1_i1.p1  ORF type:complete len:565 (+),score=178.30 TRINITY_DN35779_c0_g1_i1:273-1967(+)
MAENLLATPGAAGGGEAPKASKKRQREEATGADGEAGRALDKELRKRMKKYARGAPQGFKRLGDKKLKGVLKAREKLHGEGALAAAKAEKWLLPSEAGLLEAEGVERTPNFQQEAIVGAVGLASGRRAFDLKLPPELGPYCLDYTRNGRFLLLGGQKGHLSLLDWQRHFPVLEIQVKEKVRAVRFLHNEMFFAAAQKKYVYIYDKRGLEVHCLKEHREVLQMEFLPQHFLLATVGRTGVLQYLDSSTGESVAEWRTKRGRCAVMAANPSNGVLQLGHSNGTVTLWTPNLSAPLASLLCHRGPVTSLAVDPSGRSLVTAGLDGQVKVWDLRTFRERHAYFAPSPAHALALSQKSLLAVGHGSGVQVWQDALETKQKAPYLSHRVFGSASVQELHFCPYEDVLGIGHAQGFSSILVPGAGEPNFDSFVAAPFQTRQQRREAEVRGLLDKLQADMIVLDPQSIATVQRGHREQLADSRAQQEAAETAAARRAVGLKANGKERQKAKGRMKASKRQRRKQENIVEAKKPRIRGQQQEKRRAAAKGAPAGAGEAEGGALTRFARKRELR